MAAVGAITLDGKATRDEIFIDLSERVAALTAAGRTPGLGTVLVGDDPGSQAYVRGKHADCAKVGINSIRRDLPADISQAKLDETIDELNANPDCTGYIVQLPLPKHLNENAALERVDPGKDADGLHPMNLGRLVLNEPAPLPCTPRGIVHLLRRYEVEIAGAHVVVIGRGVTVGRPLGLLLTRRSENATVTLCHTATRHLPQLTREADIIIAAAGVPHMVTAEMVRPGAAVVDVGVSRDDEGKLVGDVHPDVWEVAGHVSPNPGGVGPLTRAFLLTNVVERAEAAMSARAKSHSASDERSREEPRSSDERSREEPSASAVMIREFARKVFAGQWPILLVGLIFIAAFVLVVAGYWRRGALVMAIGVGVAAVLRLALTEDRAGLLAVRSRGIDFATTATVSAAMLYIAWTIDPLGTS